MEVTLLTSLRKLLLLLSMMLYWTNRPPRCAQETLAHVIITVRDVRSRVAKLETVSLGAAQGKRDSC